MSNRELLLNATKALGIDGYYICETSDLPEGMWCADNDGGAYHWNPILCTDQMLEMAIKLQIDICLYSAACVASSFDARTVNELYNSDAISAVRLAVTKCAASMWGGDNDAN